MPRLAIQLLCLVATCGVAAASLPSAQTSGAEGAEPPLNLPSLWELALAKNPALREAAADAEAARGRLIQAHQYPNPRFSYSEEALGARPAPPGELSVQLSQEIVTAGKRRLDIAIASRDVDAAAWASLGRKFEVLTRIRRAYYEYLEWRYTVQVNAQVVANLQQGLDITRKLVEQAKTRPRTDVLRLQALLEEAQSNQAASRITLGSVWSQLAAEVGVPALPLPETADDATERAPQWDADRVLARVLEANTQVQQAAADLGRARLEVDRARAEAVPNVTIGGGYFRDYPDGFGGGIISVETSLPLWDRKQGRVYEAKARRERSEALLGTVVTQLSRDTAEALGRYQAARQRVERLTTEVLPRLEETLDLVRRGYQAGGAEITFADVLLAQQALDDARLRLADVRRDLSRAVADLQGLMQLDIGEEVCSPANP